MPVTGVVPWMELDVDDEDSLAPRLGRTVAPAAVDVAVIRLPHISNFTDFSPLEQQPGLGVRYVSHPRTLGEPDLVILPAQKHPGRPCLAAPSAEWKLPFSSWRAGAFPF